MLKTSNLDSIVVRTVQQQQSSFAKLKEVEKGQRGSNNPLILFFFRILISKFSPLELGILHFWLQIRILHVKITPGHTRTPLETDL